jgi:hypothetical protein
VPLTRHSGFAVLGLQAAALKPLVNPGGDLGPQADLGGEESVDFKAGQLPTLLIQLREGSSRRPNELAPQFLIRQEPPDGSFNRSL